jgi:hypothetical protein
MRTIALCIIILTGWTVSAFASPESAALDASMQSRTPVCIDRTTQERGISAERAAAFCDCQRQIILSTLTAPEMSAMLKAQEPNPSDETARVVLAAMGKFLPARQKACGF